MKVLVRCAQSRAALATPLSWISCISRRVGGSAGENVTCSEGWFASPSGEGEELDGTRWFLEPLSFPRTTRSFRMMGWVA